jgi:hypothetical protein
MSVLLSLQNKYGFTLKDRTNQDGDPDWVIEKDGVVYNVEVKQKESDDFFLQRIYSFLCGFSLLKENSFLREKIWTFKFLKNKKNYEEEKNIWHSLIKFIEQKGDCFEDENILLFSRQCIGKIEFLNKCPMSYKYAQENYQEKLITTISNNELFEVIKPLFEKLKSKKLKFENKNFISAIVFHNNFHDKLDKSFSNFMELQVDKYGIKPCLLMIYHTIDETETFFYE